MSIRAIHGDCRDVLKTLPDESVHCVVCSPPYYGLRDYGIAGQIGLEATPDAYVAELVAVFREVRRVLRSDGTLWLNLGDSYAGHNATGFRPGNEAKNGGVSNKNGVGTLAGYKAKDLIGIPWMVAFALRADGWWLRQDIIWSKCNPMPESVRDRCTKAHEYLFLLSKSPRYFWDAEAIAEAASVAVSDFVPATGANNYGKAATEGQDFRTHTRSGGGQLGKAGTRNKRSVWEVATAPFSEAHFATFPPALIEPCIKTGCPAKACARCGKPWVREVERSTSLESGSGRAGNKPNGKWNNTGQTESGSYDIRMGPVVTSRTLGFSPSCSCNAATVPGTVLDCFSGAGTTGLVADRLGRDAILIELNEDYSGMSRRRIHDDAPLFAEVLA